MAHLRWSRVCLCQVDGVVLRFAGVDCESTTWSTSSGAGLRLVPVSAWPPSRGGDGRRGSASTARAGDNGRACDGRRDARLGQATRSEAPLSSETRYLGGRSRTGRLTRHGPGGGTCQGTVPTALICALESASLEDVVRNAVSLGGDADTLAAIAGAIGEAPHGLPEGLVRTARERYPWNVEGIMGALDALYERENPDEGPESTTDQRS